jgi:predicted TIM-barrel fold metal-dependent hydrolase
MYLQGLGDMERIAGRIRQGSAVPNEVVALRDYLMTMPRLRDLQPKVLLGSDFPNIPHPYGEQLAGLARLDLGDEWLRAVCWNNAVRVFGTPD